MKAMLKTTFERYGKYITGHIEDAEMYEKVKSKELAWKPNMWQSITHIRVPKEVFVRLLKLDRNDADTKIRDYDEVLENWQKLSDSYTAATKEAYDKGRADAAKELLDEIARRLPTDKTFNSSDIQMGYAWAMTAVQRLLNEINAERSQDE